MHNFPLTSYFSPLTSRLYLHIINALSLLMKKEKKQKTATSNFPATRRHKT